MMNPHPIPDSYWVEPGRFLAGEYPGAKSNAAALKKLQLLADAGVTYFVDLTEAGEYGLNPYGPLLMQVKSPSGRGLKHKRLAIPDMGTPSAELMRQILQTIRDAMAAGEVVYVHCYGGIGRTGTTVGCYLVEEGVDADDVIDNIARRRKNTPDGHRASPETSAQRHFILQWRNHSAP